MGVFRARRWSRPLWRLALPVSMQACVPALFGLADLALLARHGEAFVAAWGLAGRFQFIGGMLVGAVQAVALVRLVQAAAGTPAHGAAEAAALRRVTRRLAAALAALQLAAAAWLAPAFSSTPEVVAALAPLLAAGTGWIALHGEVLWRATLWRAAGDTVRPLHAALAGAGVQTAGVGLATWSAAGATATVAPGAFAAALGGAALAGKLAETLWLRAAPQQPDAPATVADASRLARAATPVAANELAWAGGRFAGELVLSHADTRLLGLVLVAGQLRSFVVAAFSGLGAGTALLAARAFARRRWRRALAIGRDAARQGLWAGWAAGAALGAALAAALGAFAAPATAFGVVALLLAAGLKVHNTVMVVGVLRAAGDTRYPLRVELLALWGTALPLLWLATRGGAPLLGVAAALASEDLLKAWLLRRRTSRPGWPPAADTRAA